MNCVYCGTINDRNYVSCRACGRIRVIGAGPTSRAPRPPPMIPAVIGPPGHRARTPQPAPTGPSPHPPSGPPPGQPPSQPAGQGGATGRTWAARVGGLVVSLVTVVGGVVGIVQFVKPQKSEPPTVNVMPAPAAPPQAVPLQTPGSDVDRCIVGRWSATAYSKAFVVDDVTVTIRMVSGAGFTLTMRADGTGAESFRTGPMLRGTGGGYTVVLQESGDGAFRYGEHDGVLTFDYSASSYEFRLFVNDEEIPEDSVEWTDVYTVNYDCNGNRLVLSTDASRVEYSRA